MAGKVGMESPTSVDATVTEQY